MGRRAALANSRALWSSGKGRLQRLINQLSSIGDLKELWVAEPQYITLTGSDVATWTGAVNGHEWSNVALAPPAWEAAGWSDGGGTVTVATGEELQCSTLDDAETSNDWTFMIAQNQTDVATAQQIALSFGTNGLSCAMTTSTTARQACFDGTAYRRSSVATATGEQINTWRFDSNTSQTTSWRSGVRVGQGNYDNTAGITATQYLGRYPALTSNLSKIRIVAMWRSALSDADFERAENIISGYTGVAVASREDAVQDRHSSGLIMHHRDHRISDDAGDTVGTWIDKGPNGRNATSLGFDPGVTLFGGHVALDFDGTDDVLYLGATEVSTSTTWTMFDVFIDKDTSVNEPCWSNRSEGAPSPGTLCYYGEQALGPSGVFMNTTAPAASIAAGAHIQDRIRTRAVTCDGLRRRVYLDGVLVFKDNTDITANPGTELGLGRFAQDSTNYAALSLAEFAQWDRALTTADIADLHDYAVRRYGFTAIGTEADVLAVSNLELFYKPNKTNETRTGNNVEAIDDLSSAAHDFAYDVADSPGLLVVSSEYLNGQRAVSFENGDARHESQDTAATWKFLSDGSGASVVMAVARTNNQANYVILDQARNNLNSVGMTIYSSGVIGFDGSGSTTVYNVAGGGATVPLNEPVVVTIRVDNSNVNIRHDWSQVGDATPGTFPVGNPTYPVAIGGLAEFGSGPIAFDGEVGAVAIVSSYITGDDLGRLETYMTNTFNPFVDS